MKKILKTIWKPFDWFLSLCSWLTLAILLDIGIIYVGWYLYSNQHVYEEVHKIYRKIQAASGQGQDRIPLRIVQSDQINAYCDGIQIVMYTGLIDNAKNYDEIAMVLGHELAHQNLEHLRRMYDPPGVKRQVTEANADKLGAVYMMKAGYDICVAREFWKRMRNEEGNSLLKSHPNYSYRYDELNINCGD